jgi:hypothetical protein
LQVCSADIDLTQGQKVANPPFNIFSTVYILYRGVDCRITGMLMNRDIDIQGCRHSGMKTSEMLAS